MHVRTWAEVIYIYSPRVPKSQCVNGHLRYYTLHCWLCFLSQTADDVDDCPWFGTIYPIIGGDTPLFGIASVGQELSNGTRCEFILKYRVKIGTEPAQLYTKRSSCTG